MPGSVILKKIVREVMRILRQFFIIIFISFIAELLKLFIRLSIPASIYGLVIVLSLLLAGVMKVEQIKDVSYFLIEIMPIMFLPAAVGLIKAWPTLKPIFIPIIVITLVSTVLVMGISAKTTEFVILMKEKRKK